MRKLKEKVKGIRRTGIILTLLLSILCTSIYVQPIIVNASESEKALAVMKEKMDVKLEETEQPESKQSEATGKQELESKQIILEEPESRQQKDKITEEPESKQQKDKIIEETESEQQKDKITEELESRPEDISKEKIESKQAEDTSKKESEPEQGEDTIQNGLVQQENQYVLYIEGIQITEEGWIELSGEKFYVSKDGFVTARMEEIQGKWKFYSYHSDTQEWEKQINSWKTVLEKEYYFNKSGSCTRIYDINKKQLSIVKNGQSMLANNQEYVLSNGKIYYFNAKGIKTTKKGWKKVSGKKYIQIGKKGYVVSKVENIKDAWKYYKYNYNISKWENQKDVWKCENGKEYYFSKKGICTKIYDTKTGKCKKYSNGKMIVIKNEVFRLRNGKMYYFNAKGIRDTKKGWKKVSGNKYVKIGTKGYIISKMINTKGTWKYYKHNYKTAKWEKQQEVWETVNTKEYYFNNKGICTKIYNKKTRKCQKYSNKKMITVKNEIIRLQNGKMYYFNKKGIRITSRGWKQISNEKYVQVGTKGYIISRMQSIKGTWKYYKYNYKVEKWLVQKNVWNKVNGKQYYFNKSGNCIRVYDTATRQCFDCKNGNMILVTNDIRYICAIRYYFGSNGVKCSSAGLYLTTPGQLIYAQSNGHVTKIILGELLEYKTSEGKITSCRVKEAQYMCYYNGEGILKRKIDLNGKMVALTYDDGPSQYTSAILDTLGQYGSVATFFVLGQRVSDFSDTIKRTYEMGCEIGNHTYSHQILTRVGVSSIQDQIASTNAAVQAVTGVSPVVMRPPGGGYNEMVKSTVGMPLILWSIDTLDWKTRNAHSTQAAVLDHVKDGDIVLMHDLYSQTAEASKIIIPELVHRGYQLVTISELADCRGGMLNGMVYRMFQ